MLKFVVVSWYNVAWLVFGGSSEMPSMSAVPGIDHCTVALLLCGTFAGFKAVLTWI